MVDKKGGGWIQLEESAGKVLLSSTYKRTELSTATQATLANEAAQALEDASMQEANRERLDSEAIDYKMAGIELEESKEPPHSIDSDSQLPDSQTSNGKESSF